VNRQIKAPRAWDDVAKRMMYVEIIEQFDDMLGFRFDHFETDRPIYMWPTGLHDRNGKEIYEGDILQDHKWDAGLLKVYWSEEMGGWSVNLITQYAEQFHEWLADYHEGAEVIGNVWEDGDLFNDR
jgi:uncharacterized phage protein (TIGR01671 family)